jgi:hypothetical protein
MLYVGINCDLPTVAIGQKPGGMPTQLFQVQYFSESLHVAKN